jgi:hypothetical protein
VRWEKQWREPAPGELSLRFRRSFAISTVEAATIAGLVEEAERQWTIERQRLEVQRQQWIREEQERRRAQDLKASRDELFAIIEAWAVAKRIEEFFAAAEFSRGARELPHYMAEPPEQVSIEVRAERWGCRLPSPTLLASRSHEGRRYPPPDRRAGQLLAGSGW